MAIEHSLTIDAPVARVWELTIDIEAWPRFNPNVTRVERLDIAPLSVGSRARLKQPGQRPRIWTVTELDPMRRFAWHSRMLGTQVSATHTLHPAGESTTSTLTIDLTGRMARVVESLLGRLIRAALARENEGLAVAAGSGAAP